MHVLLKPAELNVVKNSKQTSIIGFTISSLVAISTSYRNTSRSIVYLIFTAFGRLELEAGAGVL